MLAGGLPAPIDLLAIRTWPAGFPTDISTLRRAPFESCADAIMDRQVLAELAAERGWSVRCDDATRVLTDAAALLGDRSDEVLTGPRARLGPPWTNDHRAAPAATIVTG